MLSKVEHGEIYGPDVEIVAIPSTHSGRSIGQNPVIWLRLTAGRLGRAASWSLRRKADGE